MSKPDYSLSTNIGELECPWCGEKGIVDYEDFEDGNGAETENGVPDENAWRTVLLQTIADLEGSGIPPAQNKDALQTNNKESRL